jgi:hypothetical protein
MTNEERQLIADALRQRITEISKLFEQPGAHVPQENVSQAMKAQILLLAQALDHGFAEHLFVGTVQREINRSEARPEQETQEAEANPFDKLWAAAGVSEDGFVPAVDPADMKSICRMGRESLAAAQAAGSTGGHAVGMSAYKSVCSPEANVTAAWYRVSMLGLCEQMGLFPGSKRDGDFTEAVYRVAATFPMRKMEMDVTYQGPPFDVDEFVKQVERASTGQL